MRPLPHRYAVDWRTECDQARAVTKDARDEALLETLTGMYNTGEVRCAEGRLRVSPLLDASEIRLRGPSAWDYSVRFPYDRLVELVDQSRVPVSDELVRMLMCLIYHHPERYQWATRERPGRYGEVAGQPNRHLPPDRA